MRINPNHNYQVKLPLKHADIFDIQGAVEEIHILRDWLDALVGWQPNMYSMKIHSQGRVVDIWFLEERHALLCTLRWV